MITFIYVLRCPITNEIRYVGKTNNPLQRFKAHNNKARDVNTYKRNWINSLRKEGLKPVFEIIEECSIDIWKEREKYWIEFYIKEGCKLTNYITKSGQGLTFGNKTSYDGSNAIKVVALKKDGTYFNSFNSIYEATSFINKKGIDSVLSGKTKTAGGYIWLYEEDYFSYTDEEIKAIIKNALDNSKKGISTRFKKGHTAWNKGKNIKLKGDKNVHQYSSLTGLFIDTYKTAKEASTKLKINAEGIGQCCRGRAKSAGGYVWSYEKTDKIEPIVYKGKTNNKIKDKLI